MDMIRKFISFGEAVNWIAFREMDATDRIQQPDTVYLDEYLLNLLQRIKQVPGLEEKIKNGTAPDPGEFDLDGEPLSDSKKFFASSNPAKMYKLIQNSEEKLEVLIAERAERIEERAKDVQAVQYAVQSLAERIASKQLVVFQGLTVEPYKTDKPESWVAPYLGDLPKGWFARSAILIAFQVPIAAPESKEVLDVAELRNYWCDYVALNLEKGRRPTKKAAFSEIVKAHSGKKIHKNVFLELFAAPPTPKEWQVSGRHKTFIVSKS